MDGGSLSSQVFALFRSGLAAGDSVSISVSDGLTQGEKYRFVTTATNTHGESDFSVELRVAVSNLPQ